MRRPFPSLSDQIHRSFHADGSGNSNVSYPEIPETVSAWVQGPYAHQIGKPLTLDARGSYSTRGDLVTYEWDLDGDGQYEIESTGPMLAHTWESEYVGDIHLRVTVPQGFTDTASTDAVFTNDGDGISDERDPHGTAQHRSKHQPRPQHGTDSHPHAVGPVCTDR